MKRFPRHARRIAGFQLFRVQQGLEPSDWKPMASVGVGVHEIRVHTDAEYRVLYLARFTEGIYVLHAFEKRARKTPRAELDLARTRYQELVERRRRQGHGKA